MRCAPVEACGVASLSVRAIQGARLAGDVRQGRSTSGAIVVAGVCAASSGPRAPAAHATALAPP
jgi:hypothetical protein